jgi:hypothetical protein
MEIRQETRPQEMCFGEVRDEGSMTEGEEKEARKTEGSPPKQGLRGRRVNGNKGSKGCGNDEAIGHDEAIADDEDSKANEASDAREASEASEATGDNEASRSQRANGASGDDQSSEGSKARRKRRQVEESVATSKQSEYPCDAALCGYRKMR